MFAAFFGLRGEDARGMTKAVARTHRCVLCLVLVAGLLPLLVFAVEWRLLLCGAPVPEGVVEEGWSNLVAGAAAQTAIITFSSMLFLCTAYCAFQRGLRRKSGCLMMCAVISDGCCATCTGIFAVAMILARIVQLTDGAEAPAPITCCATLAMQLALVVALVRSTYRGCVLMRRSAEDDPAALTLAVCTASRSTGSASSSSDTESDPASNDVEGVLPSRGRP
mmetsp:Transcript_79957/g.224424  ORF Transcript_79957/g.224424 Transcript_79957/m.224424 type:complete len:222 (-) Transcript_79957:138-803(-)